MKAKYITISETDLNRKVHELAMQQLDEYKEELYKAVNDDVFNQALAVCFMALEMNGWRKKRLTDFLHQVDDLTHMMYCGIMGREATARDAQQHLKEAYGIDFEISLYDAEYAAEDEKEASA